MAEKLIPMYRDGQPVEMAISERDFFHAKLARKGDAGDAGELVTYAEAGYRLGDRYESLEIYDGPKTQRQYDRAQDDKPAAKAADEKPAKAQAEARKAD